MPTPAPPSRVDLTDEELGWIKQRAAECGYSPKQVAAAAGIARSTAYRLWSDPPARLTRGTHAALMEWAGSAQPIQVVDEPPEEPVKRRRLSTRMSDFTPQVHALILRAAHAQSLGPRKVADLCGIPRGTVQRLWSDPPSRITTSILEALVSGLGLSEDALTAAEEARPGHDLVLVKLDQLTLDRLTAALNNVAARPPGRRFVARDARRLLHQIGA